MNVGKRIKQLRMSKNMTQEELGKKIGVQRAAVQKWESGKVQNLKRTTIVKLANIFSVSPSEFVIEEDQDNEYKVPVLGAIACGKPILAIENVDDYIIINKNISCDFSLVCHGDSMINARIFDGDYVFVRAQDNVENGEIAAVLVDDTDTFEKRATLKRVYRYSDRIELHPENPMYTVSKFEKEKMNAVKILGKVVAFFSIVK